MQRLHLALSAWKLWPVTDAAVYEYGCIAARLRRRGLEIQQNDIMIAAIALTLGNCTGVTLDGDLRQIPHLAVDTWVS
jgi:tRNA(fMet)-specific endonuclease VapC